MPITSPPVGGPRAAAVEADTNPPGADVLRQVVASQARSAAIARSVVAAVLIVVVLLNGESVRWFFDGPREASLANAAALSTHAYVRVTDGKLVDSGLRERTTRTRNGVPVGSPTTSATYGLLVEPGGQLMLVKANGSRLPTGSAFEGVLTPVTAEEARQVNVLLKEANLPPGTSVLPMRLDVQHIDATSLVVDVILSALAALMLVLAARAVLVSLRPATHAVFTRLNSSDWGKRLLDEIASTRTKFSGVTLLRSGLVSRGWLFSTTVDARPPEAIVWAYQKVTTTKVYGVVPVSKSNALVLALRDGQRLHANNGERDIHSLLGWLQTNMPWVPLGYSSELESMYQRRRTELVAAVDARRLAAMRG
jgi:hypothetical protein